VFILLTAKNDLLRRVRDPLGLLIWMGIPVAIAVMIQLAFGGGGGGGPVAHVLVADEDDSFLSELLLGALSRQAEGSMPFRGESVARDIGLERMDAGEATALIVIPAGFGKALVEETPIALELVTNPAQRILPRMVEGSLELLVEAHFYLHRILGEPIRELAVELPEDEVVLPDILIAAQSIAINRIVEQLGEVLFPPRITVEAAAEPDDEEGAGGLGIGELFFPSMLFMTLFFLASGLSEDVWVEKQQGALLRVLTGPHGAGAFLLGKLLSGMVLIAASALVGMGIAAWGFGLQLENIWLAVIWASLAGGLFTVLLTTVQLFAASQRAGSMLTNLLLMPLLMIGGSFFPFEAMPEWMADIGRKTPNGWALEQLKAILANRYDVADLALASAGIVLVMLLLTGLSTRRMRTGFLWV
jgi:hypothetical protein